MPSFASRSNFPKISSPPPIRLPPSSHSSQPPRFPIPSPSSLALLFLLERPRESLSSFRTLLPTVPLPHSHRPRRYRFLSSSSALLLSHPSQASRVCRPRRRARCTSSSSSVEPSFRVCQLVFPLARRGPRGGGEEGGRRGDGRETLWSALRERHGRRMEEKGGGQRERPPPIGSFRNILRAKLRRRSFRCLQESMSEDQPANRSDRLSRYLPFDLSLFPP